jgi:glycosyltransferase involved in cell wall biosynthesis
VLSAARFVHFTAEQERLEASALRFPHQPLVIPNPVDVVSASPGEVRGRFRARNPQTAGRPIVLFLSRIDRKKGLDLLIPAFRQVLMRNPNVLLVIAGDGDADLMSALRRKVEGCGMVGSVLFVGFLTGAAKFEMLADADVFVLPSYSENFGIAAVEAMAWGLPVVLTDQVAIHHEIAENRAGIVTKATVTSLADALVSLLADGALRSALGNNARFLANSKFSVEVVLDRIVETYERTLQPAPIAAATQSTGQNRSQSLVP